MKHLKLSRGYHSNEVTLGLLQVDNLLFYTLELPWKDNKDFISCIPMGEYELHPYESPKFPNVYEVAGVPERDKILIHIGNVAADVQGCILVGMRPGWMKGKRAVLDSAIAMKKLRECLGREKALITITGEK